jgi:hypothetical protein
VAKEDDRLVGGRVPGLVLVRAFLAQ